MLEDKLNSDLKQAMLAGDAFATTSIRTLKSAILYAKVAAGTRGEILPNDKVIAILQKEAKKRQESADLYLQGGNDEKAKQELAEKKHIERYLPAQLNEVDLATIVDSIIGEMGEPLEASLGMIIQKVRERTLGRADGKSITRLVKERLQL